MSAAKRIVFEVNERNILTNFVNKNKDASTLPMECSRKRFYLQFFVCAAITDCFIYVFMKGK